MTETAQAPPKTRGPGQPQKIDEVMAKRIFVLYAYGLTDQQIAETFGIARSTVSEFKKKAEYSDTIKRAKEEADLAVVNALFQRAVGYTHDEEKLFQHNGKIIRATTKKQYAPDTDAISLWLFNRRSDQWKPAKNMEIPPPADDKTPRSLHQLFLTVREKETVAIRAGEGEMEVLFGKDAVQKLKNDKTKRKPRV